MFCLFLYSVKPFPRNPGISDDSLYFGSFLPVLASFGGEFPSNDAFLDQSNVIGLFQSEKFPDFIGSLRSKTSWNFLVGETGDFVLALFGDYQGQNRNVMTDDAASDRTASPFPGPARAVALLVFVQ